MKSTLFALKHHPQNMSIIARPFITPKREFWQTDEMPQNARSALFAKIKHSVNVNFKSLTCDPLVCRMNHLRLNLSNQMEEFSGIQLCHRNK